MLTAIGLFLVINKKIKFWISKIFDQSGKYVKQFLQNLEQLQRLQLFLERFKSRKMSEQVAIRRHIGTMKIALNQETISIHCTSLLNFN